MRNLSLIVFFITIINTQVDTLVTINASSYTSLLTQNYQVKITGTSGLNDLVSTISGHTGNITVHVVIDTVGNQGSSIADKFKISYNNGSLDIY